MWFKSKVEGLLFVLWFAGLMVAVVFGIALFKATVIPQDIRPMFPFIVPLCYMWLSTFIKGVNDGPFVPTSPRVLIGSVIVGLLVIGAGMELLTN